MLIRLQATKALMHELSCKDLSRTRQKYRGEKVNNPQTSLRVGFLMHVTKLANMGCTYP